jgi:hypothetical protein
MASCRGLLAGQGKAYLGSNAFYKMFIFSASPPELCITSHQKDLKINPAGTREAENASGGIQIL